MLGKKIFINESFIFSLKIKGTNSTPSLIAKDWVISLLLILGLETEEYFGLFQASMMELFIWKQLKTFYSR